MLVKQCSRIKPIKRPKISVIIPCYNAENFVENALNSILEQDLKEFEAICINDGSKDETLRILNKFRRKDSRFKIINFTRNKGVSYARNIGIAKASTDYIVFLDSDDALTQEALSEFFGTFKKTNADIIISQCSINNKNAYTLKTEYLDGKCLFSPTELTDYLLTFTYGGCGGKAVNKKFLVKNRIRFEELKRSEDVLYFNKVMVLSEKIAIIDKILYQIINKNKNSRENRIDINPFTFWEAIQETKKFLVKNKLYDKYNRTFINSNIVRTVYNIYKLKDVRKISISEVKEFYIKNRMINKIIYELELFDHKNSFFYVEEYKYFVEFIVSE